MSTRDNADPPDDPGPKMLVDNGFRNRLRRLIDAATYGLVVTFLIGFGAYVVGWPFGGDLRTIKHVLFIFGWIAFGYGILKLWPRRSEYEAKGSTRQGPKNLFRFGSPTSDNDLAETSLQRRIRNTPGLSRLTLEPKERWSNGARIFLLGIIALFISLVLEIWFGI